jgi:hypothetical protein
MCEPVCRSTVYPILRNALTNSAELQSRGSFIESFDAGRAKLRHAIKTLNGQNFVADKMQTDHLRTIRRVSKMAGDRVPYHRPQFRKGIPFGENRMTDRLGRIAPIDFILTNLKNDFLDVHP